MATPKPRKGYFSKSTTVLTPLPLRDQSKPTKKQLEALKLFVQHYKYDHIGRLLDVTGEAIKDRINACRRKGLLDGNTITKLGKKVLDMGEVGVQVPRKKNIHVNQFTIDIKRLPLQWNQGIFYLQTFHALDCWRTQHTNTVNLIFENCKIQIFDTKKKITFWVREQVCTHYQECDSRVFDMFLDHVKILEGNGFELGRTITNSDAHFADPSGFFAQMAKKVTAEGFEIETDLGMIWFDFSKGVIEEETNNEDIAHLLETFPKSAIDTGLNMYDVQRIDERLTKLIHLVETVAKVQALQFAPPKPEMPQGRGDYFG